MADAVHSASNYESDQMDVSKSSECESTNYTNHSHIFKVFEVLQSLGKYVVTCDTFNSSRINITNRCLI